MARGDLVLKLVQAGMSGDKQLFEKTTEAIISEEKAKDHHIFASRLEKNLKKERKNNSPQSAQTFYLKNKDSKNTPLIERNARYTFDDLILSNDIQRICNEFIEEQKKSEILHAHNIEPRHRILLTGPPGNGKTSLSEAIANELMLPYYVVSYEQLITSYLGETAKNINKIIDFVSKRHCVLFFDEFEVLGKERGDSKETGEIKRVVSSLLMQVDNLPSNVVVITATNHPELLDRAVWRRFQIKLNLDLPDVGEIVKWLNKFEDKVDSDFDLDKENLAEKLFGMSFSEIEEFSLDIYRRIILSNAKCINNIIQERLKQLNK